MGESTWSFMIRGKEHCTNKGEWEWLAKKEGGVEEGASFYVTAIAEMIN